MWGSGVAEYRLDAAKVAMIMIILYRLRARAGTVPQRPSGSVMDLPVDVPDSRIAEYPSNEHVLRLHGCIHIAQSRTTSLEILGRRLR